MRCNGSNSCNGSKRPAILAGISGSKGVMLAITPEWLYTDSFYVEPLSGGGN